MKKEFVGKYYGDKKIVDVVKLEDKTYFGKERIKLSFKGEDCFEMPLELAKEVITKESVDDSELVRKRTDYVLSRIMALLAETELNHFESTMHVAQVLEGIINQKSIEANTIMWGKEPRDITLLDVDKILDPKKYENN